MTARAASLVTSVFCSLVLVACSESNHRPVVAKPVPMAESFAVVAAPQAQQQVIHAARSRVDTGERYDPAYVRMAYPNGDVPSGRGVCTDVVIRAYRVLGIDLQQLVHEDMTRAFSAYPTTWGLRAPDTNIDHRRVPNLEVFFARQGSGLSISTKPGDYLPGDLVSWRLADGRPHIGIVSDRVHRGSGRPLVIHNIGAGSVENDVLFSYRITGHFRFYPGGT
jgi:uncharacterized protein